MKKILAKGTALCLALALLAALAACGGGESANTQAPATQAPAANTQAPADPAGGEDSGKKNWTGFHGWLDEDFDAKDISYQFTGYWDLGDAAYNMSISFLMNLYADGSVLVDQYGGPQGQDYHYFGSWELVEDPDGDELDIKIVEETNESGELIDHKYSYTVYEESDSGFSFGYDFGIAAGQYFRVASLAGSSEAAYDSLQAFKDAADAGAFVTAPAEDPNAGEGDGEGEGTDGEEGGEGSEEPTGYTCPIDLGGNEMTATLTLNDDTTATFVAAMTYDVTYEKKGNAVVLTPAGELEEGNKTAIWDSVKHIYVLNDEDMTMAPAETIYEAGDLLLILMDSETMRVEFPQYNMARDGFGYTLSEDGTSLTVTSTPDADTMGAFQQIWDAMGGTDWTIDGTTAAVVAAAE